MDKSFDNVAIIELPKCIDPNAWVFYQEDDDDYNTCKKNVLNWLQNVIDKWENLNFIVKWPDGENNKASLERYEFYETIIKNLKGEVHIVDNRDKMTKEITFDLETLKIRIELRNGIVLTADYESTPALLKLLKCIEYGLIEIAREEEFAE